jgi:hypothetical protein
MRKWLLAMTVFLALLVLGGVALAQYAGGYSPYAQDYSPATNGCPPEAKVGVDSPWCLYIPIEVVTGRVTGTACGDAAVTIRHTSLCAGINNRLVGAGRTTADGAFTVPLSETLQLVPR